MAIDINLTLELHAKWLRGEKDGRRADLTGANLTGANLTDADLTDANLTGANLTGANLTRADLTGANLTGANLTRADLTDANLTDANLTGANLAGANLAGANLTDANLTGAYVDYSYGWQFHCRCSRFTASAKFFYQSLAHLASLKPAKGDEEEIDEIKRRIMPYAIKSHRARDLGLPVEQQELKPISIEQRLRSFLDSYPAPVEEFAREVAEAAMRFVIEDSAIKH